MVSARVLGNSTTLETGHSTLNWELVTGKLTAASPTAQEVQVNAFVAWRLRVAQPLRLLAVAVAVVMASRAAARQPAQDPMYRALAYRYIGPPGNRVEAVAAIPGDPSVIYAGAASGGVFKTSDAG